MAPLRWLRSRVRWVAAGLIMAAALGTALGSTLIGAPALAAGGTGGSPSEGGGTSGCPSSNPPNQMTLVAGTPQTTTLGSAFASGLQVALGNSDGCPVTSAAAGIPVMFSAPAGGASGVFSGSNSNIATVGAEASGAVAAPQFTANNTAGSYTVTASSQFGSVSFSLTNTAAGLPTSVVALPLKSRSASVMSRYAQPLQVRVLDSGGNPVAGATVTFTLGSGAAGTCAAGAAPGASFAGGTQATATTDASGLASSPTFTANAGAGSFTATASVSSAAVGGMESAGKGGSPSVAPASFSLLNLAGTPAKLVPGVGATQSSLVGSPFAIRLAVTVTDAQKNLVAGVLIAFSAPRAGASGRFTVRTRGPRQHVRVSHPDTVKVKTNACGIAIAPPFTADDRQGGYIVKGIVKHARPAAFALVNVAPGPAS
jgi:hypothetical protein